MAKQGFQLNHAGVKALLRSSEVLTVCKDHAYAAQSRLGVGYSVNYRIGKGRANAEITANTPMAKADNLNNNSILKALR